MRNWLEPVQPGKVVNIAHCQCPFCRQLFRKDLKHPIAGLVIDGRAIFESTTHHMIWCVKCNKLKSHSEHVCGGAKPANTKLHVCDDCKNPVKVSNVDRIVTCGNCQNPVFKALVINGKKNPGCNHCICGICAKHVCAAENCGLAFGTSGECYAHMRGSHGSWYDPVLMNVDDETDDETDDDTDYDSDCSDHSEPA